MTWIKVENETLSRFFYSSYGMEDFAEVTENQKANVPQEVAEQLYDHPSGDFSPIDRDSDTEEDNQ